MFRALYANSKFIGAKISPPNEVLVIMDDGVTNYELINIKFNSEAIIDKHEKCIKASEQDEETILNLFLEPKRTKHGRFMVTDHDL